MLQNNSIELFFELLKAGLWTVKKEGLRVDGSVDWDEVYNITSEQSVVGLLAAGIDILSANINLDVPLELKLNIVGEALQIEQQNRAMNEFVAKLVEMLRKEEVYTLLAKGQGVAQCYEKPLWRTSGDIDLFLSEVNYTKAKDLLLPLASKVEQEYVGAKHLGMTIDGWVVELHGSLHVGLPQRINRVLDDIYVDTFYGGNVRSWNNNGTQVFLLGKENDIIYVFVHFLNHFYKGGIGLRQICDWCRLLWTFRDSLDLQVIEKSIKKMGLLSEWKAFGAFVVEYLGMPIEAMPLLDVRSLKADRRLRLKVERIKDFILMSGNFGHNRDMSYFRKYPFFIRKCMSMWMRLTDLYNHTRIFPMDSLRFFPRIMFNGLKSAARGEG